MKKIKKIILLLILTTFINSCGGLSDAGKVLRNEKTQNTDAFLVKKREPLTMPPDYGKLPEPGSLESNKKSDDETINQILKMPKEQKSSSTKTGPSSIEQSVINQIRK